MTPQELRAINDFNSNMGEFKAAIASLNTLADGFHDQLDDKEVRLRSLEESEYKRTGGLYVLGSIVAFLGIERIASYIWK